MTAPTVAPSVYELAVEIAKLKKAVEGLGGPQLAYSSLTDATIPTYETVTDDDGLPVEDVAGNATEQITAVIGRQYDGRHGISVVAGPPPPTPSAATLTPKPGGVDFTWDGTWADGPTVVAPTDWTHCEVHLSTDPAGHGIFFVTKRSEITSARGATVFIPTGGGVQVYGWLVARTAAGKYALGPAAGPVAGGFITQDDLDPDIDLGGGGGGTTIFYDVDPDTPDNPTPGDLWLRQPSNVPHRYVLDDLGAGSWEPLRDPDIAAALSAAAAAQSTADTKAQVFTQASMPNSANRTLGDTWVDTDDSGKQYIWDGAWTPRLIGNAAIQPGSLVASDVIATGTIAGDLLSATAIDGKTITGATLRTAAPAAGQPRIEINSADGLRGIASDGTTKTQVGTDGKLSAVDAAISGRLEAGQVTLTPDALGEANASGDTRPVRGGMVWNSQSASPDWEEASVSVIPVGESPAYAGGEFVVLAGYDTVNDPRPGALIMRGERSFLGSMDRVAGEIRDDLNGIPHVGVEIDAETGAVTIHGRASKVARGILRRNWHNTILTNTTGADARMTGTHNITGVQLEAGRLYEAYYSGGVMNGIANSRPQLIVRIAAGTATPTVSSPWVSAALVYIVAAGSAGRTQINSKGSPFTVSASGTYSLALFLQSPQGQCDLVPHTPGHGLTVEDVGPAGSVSPTLTPVL